MIYRITDASSLYLQQQFASWQRLSQGEMNVLFVPTTGQDLKLAPGFNGRKIAENHKRKDLCYAKSPRLDNVRSVPKLNMCLNVKHKNKTIIASTRFVFLLLKLIRTAVLCRYSLEVKLHAQLFGDRAEVLGSSITKTWGALSSRQNFLCYIHRFCRAFELSSAHTHNYL